MFLFNELMDKKEIARSNNSLHLYYTEKIPPKEVSQIYLRTGK